MPAIDTQLITRELPQLVVREMSHMSVIMSREVTHQALETLAVVLTVIFGVGGSMYYMMKH
ncbi:Uu.00g118680.m01.CDS01 [Anthostomella pinea]|uniref:Uu.00g118680.m01.CDS01 n=1 Tax=Anthostomella pinea TaxID=933095 RepID=A0AAI8VGE3_9PEZI|nr:Uu.00g118680.m01.CDS01 [Anthostomella pinea]